jgi:tRNA dimethylallyltransferase
LLAKRLPGEIISADSMLVYRGMNVGTAKPTRAERRKIPHHLIDLVSSRANYSVYQHRKKAVEAIRAILARGRIPLVVGGAGLYVGALWKGISAHPAGNVRLRKQLDREADEKGISFLYERLRKIDPKRAKKIHPNDRRRILRALEIAELTGKPASEWYRTKESLRDLGYSVRVFGIHRDRAELYERINRRVEAMFQKGLVREVQRLKKVGFSKSSGQALGYREILEYVNRKRRGGVPPPLPSLIESIQRNTRHFAKRQLTWLRREGEIYWIAWNQGESARAVCDKIIKEVKKEGVIR